MFNVRIAGGHLYGKQLFTWLSLVVSLMASFVLSFFPLGVLDEIWDLIESVSEGILTYSYVFHSILFQTFQQVDSILIVFWDVGFFNEASSFQLFSNCIFRDIYICISLIFVFYFIPCFPKFPLRLCRIKFTKILRVLLTCRKSNITWYPSNTMLEKP